MSSLLPYLLLILPAAFLSVLLRRRFEIMFPATLCGTVLVLYLFAVLGGLKAGFYAVVALSALSGLLLFVLAARRGVRSALEYVLTPGLAALLFFSLLSIFLSKGRLLSGWDEFSHWGLAAKNVYLMDALWRGDTSTVLFKSYPPAVTLLQYFFLQFSGAFQERILFRGIQCLLFACMCPLFSYVRWKSWTKAVSFFGILFALPLLFYKDAYAQLYVDALMGLLCGALLLLYFLSDLDISPALRRVSFALVGSVLVLTKPAGIGLFLLVLLLLCLYRLLAKAAPMTPPPAGRRFPRDVLSALLPIAVPLLFFLTWKLYCAAVGADDGIFTKPSTFTWERLLALLCGNGEQYDLVVVRRFLQRQLERYSQTSNQNISIFAWLLLLPALSGLLARRSDPQAAPRALTLSGCLLVGYAVYAAVLLGAYLFLFNEAEALNMLSCDRYMFTYLLACVFLLVGLLITRPKASRLFVYLLMCAALIVGTKDADSTAFGNISRNVREDFAESEAFPDIMDPNADRIYLISDYYDSIDYLITRFNSTPIPVNDDVLTLEVRPAPEADALSAELLSGGYTYVYVFSASDEYAAPFAALFDDPVVSHALYAVENDNGRAHLKEALRFGEE